MSTWNDPEENITEIASHGVFNIAIEALLLEKAKEVINSSACS